MYLRKMGEDMFPEACEKWCAANRLVVPGADEAPGNSAPLEMQLSIWRRHVRKARGIAASRRRRSWTRFSPVTIRKREYWTLHLDNNRWPQPDTFQVVDDEEQVVPLMRVLQT
ncbi:uncharacterized protein P884DRAFT_269846 [Thermothelomyces heterothallicus CBS 202.75]|uniref:uncharacterized protein n=1 Tax=Thermothelomyces heterothallicus CBS 202.75 TaxID=1149848 RepID=UPI0037448989